MVNRRPSLTTLTGPARLRPSASTVGAYKPHYVYGRMGWLAGRLPTAAHHLERAEPLNPTYPAITALLAKVYERLGRAEDATAARRRCVAQAEQALDLDAGDVRALYLGACALAELGELERGMQWAERACALDPGDQVVHEYAAAVHARAGRTERTLEHLQEALDAGYRHCEWIVCEPSFEALRREPRAQALLAQWCGPEPLGAEARARRGEALAPSQPGRA